jgi:4-hydroxybenzoate polyprenyltransferase
MEGVDEAAINRTPMSVFIACVKQMRPKQWTKNGLLFAALVFSGKFTDPKYILLSAVGFGAFSLIASGGYVLNDLLDREADRKHPKKKFRPIASGTLPVPVAIVLLLLLFACGLGLAAILSPWFLGISLVYLATTLSYSWYWKHKVILDVMFLASGFVWRAIAGAIAIDSKVSLWLFLCTAFLALFLGFNKRRGELLEVGPGGGTRKTIQEYNTRLIDQYQAVITANVVLSYALYSVLGPNPWMVTTVPLVLYGVFRYIYLVDVKGEGGAPDETLYKDGPLLGTVVLYAVACVVLMGLHFQGVLPDILPEAEAILRNASSAAP